MADALLSPVVGGALWAVAAGTIAYCAKKVRQELDDGKVPLMGVLGAFVFAAQMVNFTIPLTGSSGHLGGGMILSILLGPHAAFLTIASVLIVQALFFADGGLLALGCNIVNMGAFTAFVAYPLFFRKIAGERPTPRRLALACVVSATVGLQMGAFGVVAETVLSGVAELPFATFVTIMQPIHLAIGVVEGFVTAAVVGFVWKAQPSLLENSATGQSRSGVSLRRVVLTFAVATLFLGGVVSWYASKNPDGLEWAIGKVTGSGELAEPRDGVHEAFSSWQKATAILPGYGFTPSESAPQAQPATSGAVDVGTSASGLVGGVLTLALAGVIGFVLRRRQKPSA
jgi:cobalt/nickel transport system permease protein